MNIIKQLFILLGMQEENQNDQNNQNNYVEYQVEKIVDRRKTTEGLTQYLVKWHNYSEAENSWEPVNFLINCIDRIVEYKKENKVSNIQKKNLGQGAGRNLSPASQNYQQFPKKSTLDQIFQTIQESIMPEKVENAQKKEEDEKQKIEILGLYLDLSGKKVYLVEKQSKQVVKLTRDKMEQKYLSELCKFYQKFLTF